MCLAIHVPAGQVIAEEYLINAARNNPDGCGYAFTRNGAIVTRKYDAIEAMLPQYRADSLRHGAASTFLIHFRIATHGAINKRNTHPHAMRDGGTLIHNGMLDIPELPDGESDSRYFAREVVGRLPADWQYDTVLVGMVQRYIGAGNKIAMLWPNGASLILNEAGGKWAGGVWYSNTSYLAPVYSLAAYDHWSDDQFYAPFGKGDADTFRDPYLCVQCDIRLDDDELTLGCPSCGLIPEYDCTRGDDYAQDPEPRRVVTYGKIA